MWSFLKKKCKCEDTPTNPISLCEHDGYNSNDIAICLLSSCVGIEQGDTASVFFQKLENFLCGVGLTQYILDVIQENPEDYLEFIQLINDSIDCSTIATCLLTTTSTTTIDPCNCENTLLNIGNNAGDDIKAIFINGDLITLNDGASFPIEGTVVTSNVPSTLSDIEVTVTHDIGFNSILSIFYQSSECSFAYCRTLLVGTNTYLFENVDLRCFAFIRTGIGTCSQTTTLTPTTTLAPITTTSTTTLTPTTTTTTTIICSSYYYNVELYLCEDCTLTGGGTICNSEPLVVGKWYTWNNFKILVIAFNGCDSDPCESNIISTQQDDCESVICPTTTTTTTIVPTTTTTTTLSICIEFTANGLEFGGTLSYTDCDDIPRFFELDPDQEIGPFCGKSGTFVFTGTTLITLLGPC